MVEAWILRGLKQEIAEVFEREREGCKNESMG